MKKILTLVLVSALGGILTLGAYKLLLEPEQKPIIASNHNTSTYLPTNHVKSIYNVEEKANFVAAAESTVNAVVHVKNVSVGSSQMSIQDLFFGRNPNPQYRLGTGSGVIVDPSGYIITNNHVIKNSKELSVTLNNNKTYEAEIIGADPETDIAVLKIETDEDLPVVNFGDSDQAQIGEWVLAVGNPFNLTSTVTAGIISAKSRDLTGSRSQSFIQTDAAVNPGNSGGALVNTNGELIGINTAISSQTGSYVGYSFAVPSNIARKIFMDILEYGNIQNGVLGVSILNKNSEEAKELGVNEIEGVYVSEVTRKSGAEKAGLKKGDIIKKLDHIEISKFEDLKGYLKTKRPKDVVNVKVLRDEEFLTIPVTISNIDIFSAEFMDMEFKDLSTDVKDKHNIPHGVRISKSNNKWLKNNLGITEGYIITKINDKKIESIQDISKLKEKYGDDYLENLKSLAFINRYGEKKEVIFK
ncbi:trypsin-like peptidase domain-containing protein [Gelatiniphilus marinus]|uniref:Trypsin-like peptidase domain-containing protein n=1 Tax=Gelatiniphilus marinus TaxID=1759464 RepID=A0ABW5JNL5_9FLAO